MRDTVVHTVRKAGRCQSYFIALPRAQIWPAFTHTVPEHCTLKGLPSYQGSRWLSGSSWAQGQLPTREAAGGICQGALCVWWGCLYPLLSIFLQMVWDQKGCFLLLQVTGPLSPPMGGKECPSVTPCLSGDLSHSMCLNVSTHPCAWEREHGGMRVQHPLIAKITNY